VKLQMSTCVDNPAPWFEFNSVYLPLVDPTDSSFRKDMFGRKQLGCWDCDAADGGRVGSQHR
jgi:hypothetical protein